MTLMRRWVIGQKRSDVDGSILLPPQAEILTAKRNDDSFLEWADGYTVTFVVPKDLEDVEVKAR